MFLEADCKSVIEPLVLSGNMEYQSPNEAVEAATPSSPCLCRFSNDFPEGNFISAIVPSKSRDEVEAKASGR
jgi:hypothetical protein